ncbi:unnamed protein product [Mytilus coruscus]|uniref:C-type lectin domain-containing protein n=1 Tax=Mytilus coruscus TaxID=42192 RepID=A0A6J8BF24_MYTCO|nr:unnamed protein product [Mytilus coruscus]
MCRSIHGCDMFKMTGNRCIFHRNNAGCDEIGNHNTRMFKKLTCPASWSPMNEICYLQTKQKEYCANIQNTCLSHGGNAAEFYSKEEMTNSLTVITSNVYVSGRLQGGVYLWNVTGQQIDTSLWIPNEPAEGDCVQIWKANKGLDALSGFHFMTVLCEQVNDLSNVKQ